MKKTSALVRTVAAAILFCMLFAMTSCLDSIGGNKIEKFTVVGSSVKREYYVGDEIDFSGIRIDVVYSDETLNTTYTNENATINVIYDKATVTATPGTKSIKVSMTDPVTGANRTAYVSITVHEKANEVKFDHYEIDASAVKNTYEVGETLDFTGIKLFEVMSDQTKNEIEIDPAKIVYDYDPDTFTATSGNKTVTVKYDGKDAGSIAIRVNDPEVEIIEIINIEVLGEYKTTYEVGDTADFSAISVKLTYADEQVKTLLFADLEIAALDTTEVGQKNIIIKFTDPVNSEEGSTTITVNVIEKKPTAVQFEKPASLTAFDSDNALAGTLSFGDSGFSGTFNNSASYKIGDDNLFNLLPVFAVMGNVGLNQLTNYHMTVDLSVKESDNFRALSKVVDTNDKTISNYYQDDVLIATVNTYRGTYDFTEDAVGKTVKISVLPSSDYYVSDFTAVTLEADIIDAFNVYSAKDLAVVDNVNSEWNEFKTANELFGIDPAGIVLHGDISITENDVPANFFNTSDTEVKYYDGSKEGPVIKTIPAGSKFLKDATYIYSREGAEDFVMEGNFFTISTQDFPLVASHAVFVNDAEKHYGNDYSNAALFNFGAVADNYDPSEAERPTININNLALIGNATRNKTVDAMDKLVSGGGLIFLKSAHHAITYMNNSICNSYFITYFANWRGSDLYINDSKCYDSFQNAAFVWGDCNLGIKDSYISGTGGPIIIAESVIDDADNNIRYNPIVNVTGTVMDSALVGNELWFASVGATALVDSIKALGAGLAQAGLGNFVQDNKLNVKALLMNEGINAAEAIGNKNATGTLLVDGKGIERWNEEGKFWQQIVNHLAYDQSAPFLTVGDANSPEEVIFYNGATFCDILGNELSASQLAPAIMQAFAASDTLTLSQGGISIVFEFYH